MPRRLRVWMVLLATSTVTALGAAAALAAPARNFEGPALTDLPAFDAGMPSDPEIAAGPDDLLIAARSVLIRVPNPNALGRTPSTNLAASRVNLDAWLGATALDQLCPSQPRSGASCLIDNLTVRYDQLQGRFVVLFTVVNTGMDANGMFTGIARKASWVLLVSRGAALTARGTLGGPDVFTAPAGGVNPTVWNVWYGNALEGFGTDGFGGPAKNGIGAGNINAIPGSPASNLPGVFDCRNIAIGDATRACYLPTSARLGIDNDSITIASAVYNDNIPNATRGANKAFLQPAYAGTRVRVIKKGAVYTAPLGGRTLISGSPFDPTEANRFGGQYYDLYTAADANGAPITANPVMPYTVVASQNPPPASNVTPPAAPNLLSPLFFEPAQLRGRALGSFANPPGSLASQSYLVGAIATPFADLDAQTASVLWVLGIKHARTALPTQGPIPFYPTLQGGPQTFPVDVFSDPSAASQAVARAGGTPPALFAGDARPERVIFREGHLYDARTVAFRDRYRFDGTRLATTVTYDVVRKLSLASVPLPILSATWQNARTFAPMFDVPASVAQAGQLAPVNVAAFTDRLFAATSFPALPRDHSHGRDPRYLDFETGGLVPGDHCVGASPSALGNVDAWPSLFDLRCGEDTYDSQFNVRNPATGALESLTNYPPIGAKSPFSRRGGSSTDPNDGSLWLIGTYARLRSPSIPPGVWATYVGNYKLRAPVEDEYGNPTQSYDDVPPPKSAAAAAKSPFTIAQIAAQLGLGPTSATLGIKTKVARAEAARLIVRSHMDEAAITQYLAVTGGATPSFGDVSPADPNFRYIETMVRRGYDTGCGGGQYCPTALATRAEVAVAVVRAKLGNIFAAAIAGCTPGAPIELCSVSGDNFGLFVPTELYYKDNENVADNAAYPYIQKWGELRIDDVGVSKKNGLGGKFGPTKPFTRLELLQALVRAFFS